MSKITMKHAAEQTRRVKAVQRFARGDRTEKTIQDSGIGTTAQATKGDASRSE